MKRKTFLRLTLLLPYLVLGVAFAVSVILGGSFSDTFSDNILVNLFIVFTVSAIIWGPFYTWMVVVLWLWSIHRSEKEIYRTYALSPFILAGSMGIPAILIDLPNFGRMIVWSILHFFHMDSALQFIFPDFQSQYAFQYALALFMLGGICILVGYIFVGLVAWLDRFLTKRNILIMEN